MLFVEYNAIVHISMENRIVEVGRLKSFAFKSNQNLPAKIDKLNEKVVNNYSDPLMQWPVRGLAYTNEVGVAISEVAPALGQALWIPALMYLGADIYDKYKNEGTSYNPSTHRGLKQAVFQGLASVILPTIAVLAGQKVFSLLGYIAKGHISLNSREKVSNYAVDFITSGNLAKYKDLDAECKQTFEAGIENILTFRQNERKLQDGKSWFVEFMKNPKKALSIGLSAKSAKDYAGSTIDSLINLRKELYGDTPKLKENFKWHTLVEKNILKGVSKDIAIRDVLVKYQQSQIIKSKWIKTVGGFIALALAAKPIDNFIEHVILPKVVTPSLGMLGINEGTPVVETISEVKKA